MFIDSVNGAFNNTVFISRIMSNMHEQMERLYEAADKMAATTGQAAVARLLNVSPQTVNNWEARGISTEGLLKAQEIIGCNANWLRDGTGNMLQLKISLMPVTNELATEDKKDYIAILQYKGVGGAMGNGVILRDQPGEIQRWEVTPEWIQKNVKNHTGIKNLAIVTGFGDSMKGMYNPGDPLIVDIGVKSVEYDAVYFFRVGNEGFIKRLQRIPGEGLRVISSNKEYEAWTIRPDMDFEVFARVLKAWKSEDF